MRVYRVETKDGVGPYRLCSSSFHLLVDQYLMGAGHPAPQEDGIDFYFWGDYWNFYFGFQSLEHLEDWFLPVLDVLDDYGLGIGVYEVPDEHVLVGYSQAAFRRSEARMIEYGPAKERLALLVPACS